MVVLTVVDVEVIEAPAAVVLPQATNATVAIVPVIGKSTLNKTEHYSLRVTQTACLALSNTSIIHVINLKTRVFSSTQISSSLFSF